MSLPSLLFSSYRADIWFDFNVSKLAIPGIAVPGKIVLAKISDERAILMLGIIGHELPIFSISDLNKTRNHIDAGNQSFIIHFVDFVSSGTLIENGPGKIESCQPAIFLRISFHNQASFWAFSFLVTQMTSHAMITDIHTLTASDQQNTVVFRSISRVTCHRPKILRNFSVLDCFKSDCGPEIALGKPVPTLDGGRVATDPLTQEQHAYVTKVEMEDKRPRKVLAGSVQYHTRERGVRGAGFKAVDREGGKMAVVVSSVEAESERIEESAGAACGKVVVLPFQTAGTKVQSRRCKLEDCNDGESQQYMSDIDELQKTRRDQSCVNGDTGVTGTELTARRETGGVRWEIAALSHKLDVTEMSEDGEREREGTKLAVDYLGRLTHHHPRRGGGCLYLRPDSLATFLYYGCSFALSCVASLGNRQYVDAPRPARLFHGFSINWSTGSCLLETPHDVGFNRAPGHARAPKKLFGAIDGFFKDQDLYLLPVSIELEKHCSCPLVRLASFSGSNEDADAPL
ncbi:hypothetical protein R3P38DRAFT_3575384 [Favolaschia claudopus]|uniref:Uncharacterized protein n=1 Tax=Favolaschia claudopus TaxID=2862362 RepID=A0AAW0ALW1_9AGAR